VTERRVDMKKIMATIAVVLFVLALTSFGQTQNLATESYYNKQVDKKIAILERLGKLVDSRSACVRSCAKLKISKANFLKTHREELVREMVTLKVEMEPYKVNYFLIKAFSNASPKLVCQHCSSHHSG
jgi:hypothetical protein